MTPVNVTGTPKVFSSFSNMAGESCEEQDRMNLTRFKASAEGGVNSRITRCMLGVAETQVALWRSYTCQKFDFGDRGTMAVPPE